MHCIHRTFVPTPSALTLFALTSFVPLIPLVPIIFQVRSHFHLPDRYSAPVPPDRAHRKLLCCIRSYIWGIWGHRDNPQEDLLHKAGSPVPGKSMLRHCPKQRPGVRMAQSRLPVKIHGIRFFHSRSRIENNDLICCF